MLLIPMNSKSKNDFPMSVVCEDDGTITIEWDETHPATSMLNTWTEQDFLDCILGAAKMVIAQQDGN